MYVNINKRLSHNDARMMHYCGIILYMQSMKRGQNSNGTDDGTYMILV